MDSLSQLVLGAAVGGAVLGHKSGARALIWGGIVATLPDLDVLVPLADPIDRMTYHRSASHSIFVLTLLSPFLTWLILRIHPEQQPLRRQWLLLVWLALITHVLLDCFTVYGTQIFWPLWNHPVGWDTVFIIDPLYTLPLLFGCLIALLTRRQPRRLRRWSAIALLVSTAYLGFGLVAKWHVTRVATTALAEQGIAYERLLTVPTPFNTLLWRIVAVGERNYHEGFYSLLDPLLHAETGADDPLSGHGDPAIRFESYPSRLTLLAPLQDERSVTRLAWFTKGFYKATERDGHIVMSDIRMGLEPAYVFSFVVGERRGKALEPVTPPVQVALSPNTLSAALLRELWTRLHAGADYEMRL